MRSGFSIIRNGEKLSFPYKESLRSLAPLVDELVVAVGDNEDSTREELLKLAPALPCELRLVDSPWDPAALKGGLELSRQTNIALSHCRYDTCFYLQSDEVLHEADYPRLRADLSALEAHPTAQALAFEWVHFYGSPGFTVHSRRWYRREVRAFKKNEGLKSFQDAQGFRIPVGQGWEKPRALLSQARVFHYGWVRPPSKMAEKSNSFDRLWHGEARVGIHKPENVYPWQYGIRPYAGSHPAVMQERVKESLGFDPFAGQAKRFNGEFLRLWSGDLLERATGWRMGEFLNYRAEGRT